MHGYKCFYKGRTLDVREESSYLAQIKAAFTWKVKAKNRYQIAVVLCEKDNGEIVFHSTSEI